MIVYGKDRKLQVRSEVWGGKGDTYQRDMLSEELGERPAHYKLMTEIEYPPGSELGYHQHVGTSEIYYIIEGDAIYNDNGTEVELHAGDTAICPDGSWHAIKMSAISPCGFWRPSSTPDGMKKQGWQRCSAPCFLCRKGNI